MITVEQWLEDQCDRYRVGRCMKLECRIRGGFNSATGENISGSIATCPAHEVIQRLSQASRDLAGAARGNRPQGMIDNENHEPVPVGNGPAKATNG